VTSNTALYGMMRVFEVMTSDLFAITRVFREISEAEIWLAHLAPKTASGF
jgi:hypothetical protein